MIEVKEPEDNVLNLIKRIGQGTLSGKDIAREQRRECVAIMRLRGQSAQSIAAFLKVTDRTVRRDIAQWRKDNSFTYSEDFWSKQIGEYIEETKYALNFMLKIMHDPGTNVSQKIRVASNFIMGTSMMTRTLSNIGALSSIRPVSKESIYKIVEESIAPEKAPEEVKKYMALFEFLSPPQKFSHTRKLQEALDMKNPEERREAIGDLMKKLAEDAGEKIRRHLCYEDIDIQLDSDAADSEDAP